ncbi:cytochrome c oxidase assembly protein [Celeribacter indicus]|uniref:Cytochrome c oxidase caa3-type, assembly factor CtaG-related protein n=1 Tax=Celeribacter indicus TaxID=1208324 RepID=A0A0B5E6H6_9RHOB|nr:cytochrome c oxidase assembly protein [Celeribacter indicus]AJE49055.1 Cytochrome c oxidase caa3-type, assembly factor CtaG-related protein [Celeribacter indicus]SDW44792.1 putative membrane protein [Celeribacter indicus]
MRPIFLLPALALLALLWAAPLDDWLPAFPVHMLRHMGLVAVAAPLLVLGLPPHAGRVAIQPLLAAVIEFLLVWGWHLPAAHALGRLSGAGFAAEQASFLLAGVLVWAGCLRAGHPLAGAGGLLLTSMHMTLLGALLILAPRDLYAEICGTAPDLDGQQVGGILMLAIGTPVYLFGGIALTGRALAEEPA